MPVGLDIFQNTCWLMLFRLALPPWVKIPSPGRHGSFQLCEQWKVLRCGVDNLIRGGVAGERRCHRLLLSHPHSSPHLLRDGQRCSARRGGRIADVEDGAVEALALKDVVLGSSAVGLKDLCHNA